jgi:ABC-type uncharacterized transport system involved in gliding motility auxiliary subunit
VGPEFDRGLQHWQRLGLEKLAERWGGRVGDAVVVDLKNSHPVEGARSWAAFQYGDHPIVAKMGDRVTYWPRSREVRAAPRDGLEVKELVRTTDEGFGETNLAVLRGEADLGYDAATDVKGPVPVAVAAEQKSTKTRVVVVGTPNFVMNYWLSGGMREVVSDYNRDVFLAAVSWLAAKEQLVAIGPKRPEHVKLTLTAEQLGRMFYLTVVGLPLMGLLLGVLVWWRRRS